MSKKLRYVRNVSGSISGNRFSISQGCRFISFADGTIFQFSEAQAIIIECLVEHLVDLDITHVPSSVLLAKLQHNHDSKVSDSDDASDLRSNLKDYFKNHPAWGILIKNTGPGRGSKVYLDFDLILPNEQSSEMSK